MVRVTLAAESLRGFATAGPDEHCKLVLPRAGDRIPPFDPAGNVFEQWRSLPVAIRPYLRTYTIREVRPEAAELDIDFALHHPGGPAMRWLAGARPGDPLAIYGCRGEFEPPTDADAFVLLADPAGLPALAGILESLPANADVRVIAEVGGPEEELALPTSAPVVWAHRDPAQPPFAALARELAGLGPIGAGAYVWTAGEASALAPVRRHLVAERGLSAQRLELVGYWLVGGVADAD
jgi:NADPH-dependent ferric siderophore reductase